MFSSCTELPVSEEMQLGKSNQEASPSAGKNTGVVLVPSCTWKCVPRAFPGAVCILVLGCFLLQQMSFQ